MTQLETITLEEPTTKSPTRWRNWWRCGWTGASIKLTCGGCGRVIPLVVGAPFTSDQCCAPSHPSQETAEAVAATVERDMEKALAVYLGAYPEGDRP